MDKLEIVCFIVGAVLLGVALFGGGLEIKEIKIPSAGRFSRIISGCLGPAFILIALLIGGVIPWPWTPAPAEPTTFVVSVALGTEEDAREIETEVVVSLAGKEVARMLLDSNSPADSNSVIVEKPGLYPYSLTGYTVWTTNPGRKVPVRGSGEIDVENGRSYTVRLDSIPSSTTQACRAYLREGD